MEPVSKPLPAHLKLLKREKKGGKTVKTYERTPKTRISEC